MARDKHSTLTEAAMADIDTLTEMSATKCKADHKTMAADGKKSCPACGSKLGSGGVVSESRAMFESALGALSMVRAGAYDEAKHPRGRGGKFADVLGKLDTKPSSGRRFFQTPNAPADGSDVDVPGLHKLAPYKSQALADGVTVKWVPPSQGRYGTGEFHQSGGYSTTIPGGAVDPRNFVEKAEDVPGIVKKLRADSRNKSLLHAAFEEALTEAAGSYEAQQYHFANPMHFDAKRHPRGRGGKFIDVLGKLAPGGREVKAARSAHSSDYEGQQYGFANSGGRRQAWTNAQVVERGLAGKEARNAGNSLSFHPNGHLTTVKSYDEPIASVDLKAKVAHVNTTRYSMTTAHHQSRIGGALAQAGFKIDYTNREGIHKMLGVTPGPARWPGMPGRRNWADRRRDDRVSPRDHGPGGDGLFSMLLKTKADPVEDRSYGITDYGDRRQWTGAKPPQTVAPFAEHKGITTPPGVQDQTPGAPSQGVAAGVAAGVPIDPATVPGTVATIDLRSKIASYQNPEAQVIRVLRAAPPGSVIHVTNDAIVTKQDTNRFQVVRAAPGTRGTQNFENTSAGAAMRALGRL